MPAKPIPSPTISRAAVVRMLRRAARRTGVFDYPPSIGAEVRDALRDLARRVKEGREDE